ncbi:hypothetical protein D3C78_1355250 [compost metagenome]
MSSPCRIGRVLRQSIEQRKQALFGIPQQTDRGRLYAEDLQRVDVEANQRGLERQRAEAEKVVVGFTQFGTDCQHCISLGDQFATMG